MSFIRYIYNTFFKKLIDKSWTLNDALHILELIKDIKNGIYVDKYEEKELEGSQWLAHQIDNKSELLPELRDLLNSRRGNEIKESMFQHRALVHSLFFNKPHVLSELSKIIDELEFQVRKQEDEKKLGYKVIEAPQVGSPLRK